MTENSNPFLALFEQPKSVDCDDVLQLNDIIEQVFHLTLQLRAAQNNGKLHYLEELAQSVDPQDWFDIPTLEQALFQYCLNLDESLSKYLYGCYELADRNRTAHTQSLVRVIFANVQLTLLQPELFTKRDSVEDFVRLLADFPDAPLVKQFLNGLVDFHMKNEDNPSTKYLFSPLLAKLAEKIKQQNLLIVDYSLLEAVKVLCSVPVAAEVIVSSCMLTPRSLGRDCENTLLGSLFAISCIPRGKNHPVDFFERPSRSPASVLAMIEGNIWTALEKLAANVQQIVYNLLKSSAHVNGLTRQWLGNLLRKTFIQAKID